MPLTLLYWHFLLPSELISVFFLTFSLSFSLILALTKMSPACSFRLWLALSFALTGPPWEGRTPGCTLEKMLFLF